MIRADYPYYHHGNVNGKDGENLIRKLGFKIQKLSSKERVQKICELGCGNGYFSGFLTALGYTVVGVDASASGIEIAQASYGKICRFVQSEIGPFLAKELGSAFDLVIAVDVVEHLYRPSSLLETAGVLLRPGGYLLLTTPYHGYLKNLILALTNRMDNHFHSLFDGGYIKFFSVNTLKRLMVQGGFPTTEIEFFGRFPWVWKGMICLAKKPIS